MGVFGKAKKDTQDTSTATCPHCNAVLDPIPKRKTKCPSCGKDIYVRTDPFNKQKTYYLKQDDALSLGIIRDLNISEQAFTEGYIYKSVKGVKSNYVNNQGAQHHIVTLSDVAWFDEHFVLLKKKCKCGSIIKENKDV